MSILITVLEVGGNVVLSGGGTANISSLGAPSSTGIPPAFLNFGEPRVIVGPATTADRYNIGFAGPASPNLGNINGDYAPSSTTGPSIFYKGGSSGSGH